MVVLLILIGAILSMSRYAEHREGENPQDAQASSPQAPVAPSDASKSTENADKAEHHPDFIDTFLWPEGATVWALLLTLVVIAWQSTETREAAQAARNSIRLHEAGMRQWVNIVPISVGIPPTLKTPCEVSLKFEIVNRTDYLLTILRVESSMAANISSGNASSVDSNFPLVPQKRDGDSSFPFCASVLVDVSAWSEKGRIFIVTGTVTYLDCMEIRRTQDFQDLYLGFMDGRLERMKPASISDPKS